MTRIRFTKANGSYELHAKGHSGFGKAGKDIVCAAISILLMTLIESIDEKDLTAPLTVIQREGKVLVRACPKSEKDGKICGIFNTICTGLEILQENCKKNIKFKRVVGCKSKERN